MCYRRPVILRGKEGFGIKQLWEDEKLRVRYMLKVMTNCKKNKKNKKSMTFPKAYPFYQMKHGWDMDRNYPPCINVSLVPGMVCPVLTLILPANTPAQVRRQHWPKLCPTGSTCWAENRPAAAKWAVTWAPWQRLLSIHSSQDFWLVLSLTCTS